MPPIARTPIRLITLGVFAVTVIWELVMQFNSPAPFNWTGLVIAAGVAVVILPLVWRVTRSKSHFDRLFDAKPGVGTLVSTRRTGTSVNDIPEVELELDILTSDGSTLRGKTRTFVDVTEHAALVPGTMIPVEYLEGGRVRVQPNLGEDGIRDILYSARVKQGKMTEKQVRVAKDGVRAKAVVMAIEPTGEIEDGEAVMRLAVRVTRPDGSHFDNSRDLPLPSVALPGLQPGNVIEARYLADDESYISVETRVH